MGMFDTFIGDELDKNSMLLTAQLKCFENMCDMYAPGDVVPVTKFNFPETCTFCDYGGISDSFLPGMGIFVVIKDTKLEAVTIDENKVRSPVYDKYGKIITQQHNISGYSIMEHAQDEIQKNNY